MAEKMEKAMAKASTACARNNITDPEQIREAMLEARGAVKGRETIKVRRNSKR